VAESRKKMTRSYLKQDIQVMHLFRKRVHTRTVTRVYRKIQLEIGQNIIRIGKHANMSPQMGQLNWSLPKKKKMRWAHAKHFPNPSTRSKRSSYTSKALLQNKILSHQKTTMLLGTVSPRCQRIPCSKKNCLR